MALTPETLPRHELVGLHVEVVEATNADLVGIEGRVVRETAHTLSIESLAEGDREPRVRQVPKAEATFEFALTDEAAGDRKAPGTASEPSDDGEAVAYVTVDGARLLSRPAERTETRGETTWESD